MNLNAQLNLNDDNDFFALYHGIVISMLEILMGGNTCSSLLCPAVLLVLLVPTNLNSLSLFYECNQYLLPFVRTVRAVLVHLQPASLIVIMPCCVTRPVDATMYDHTDQEQYRFATFV